MSEFCSVRINGREIPGAQIESITFGPMVPLSEPHTFVPVIPPAARVETVSGEIVWSAGDRTWYERHLQEVEAGRRDEALVPLLESVFGAPDPAAGFGGVGSPNAEIGGDGHCLPGLRGL